MGLTGRTKFAVAAFIVGVLLGGGVFAIAQSGVGSQSDNASAKLGELSDLPHYGSTEPETNVIGDQPPPSSLIEDCKADAPGVDPFDCKVALAMANGALAPGRYSDQELQQALQTAADSNAAAGSN